MTDPVVDEWSKKCATRASVGKDGVSREGAEGEHRRDLDRENGPPQIEPASRLNRRRPIFLRRSIGHWPRYAWNSFLKGTPDAAAGRRGRLGDGLDSTSGCRRRRRRRSGGARAAARPTRGRGAASAPSVGRRRSRSRWRTRVACVCSSIGFVVGCSAPVYSRSLLLPGSPSGGRTRHRRSGARSPAGRAVEGRSEQRDELVVVRQADRGASRVLEVRRDARVLRVGVEREHVHHGRSRPEARYAAPRSSMNRVGECVGREPAGPSLPRADSEPPITLISGDTSLSAS